MLNLNNPVGASGIADEEVYKILLLDRLGRDIISPLLKVDELRKHGITLHLMLDSERQNIPDVPAIYFVRPTEQNVKRIVEDAGKGVYDKFHLNFTSSIPRVLLEDLAAGTLKGDSLHRIARVHDQFMEFISLENDLFSLAQPDAYLQLNDPKAQDKDVEGAIDSIVSGLFGVVVTLGVVPIIRAPEKGPAEMVARQLDTRIRAHLSSPNNLFKESGNLSSAYQRPILCIFDRNLELAVGVQHSWTYRPLVHDVIGLKLNRVIVQQPANPASVLKQKNQTSYDLDSGDSFWSQHSNSPFPKAAEEVDLQLKKWKQEKEEVNKQPGEELDEDDIANNTKQLTAATNAVPEMVERKKIIDKHVNIGGTLLEAIRNRALDVFFSTEEELLTRGTAEKATVLDLLKTRGNAEDKIRLAVVYLLAIEQMQPADVEAVEATLRELQVDTAAIHYVKQLKRLTRSINSANMGSKDDLLDWANKIYGQGAKIVKERVQNLLSSGRQLVLTRAVEALMESRQGVETDSYLLLDPKASKGSVSSQSIQAKGPFKDAIVFMIGGGNYIEYQGLQEYAQKQQPQKTIIYGSTEILSGKEFLRQLAELGRKMGAPGIST